ncbi:MAG: hypothetical protein CMC33_01020 [Flavobacteriaceae bacterium]|nr:hypothetical protein [Flavobacteriaceae bacterium]|tara:strand:- start:7616 stop:8476 length:861 start_codon:yes stop_codon:yes gene_type:complete
MNKLILGTVQLGTKYGINNSSGQPDMNESLKILDKAYHLGVRSLDTAESYGDSYKIIGQYHKKFPSKIFKIFDKSSGLEIKDFEDKIEKKLKFLKINSFDGYMFHSTKIFQRNIHIHKDIYELKKRGLIKKIGISVYTNDEINFLINEGFQFDFIQMPFNVLDNENIRKKVIKKMINNNIDIHVRSIFLQGIFYLNYNDFPKKLEPLKKYISSIKEICNTTKYNIDDILLTYPKTKKYIKKIIFGIDNINQLEKNLHTYDKQSDIPVNDIEKINVKEKDLLNPSLW